MRINKNEISNGVKKKMFLFFAVVITVVSFILTSANIAQARGRYGSFRVGGWNSHGLGSHYVGGYVRWWR